MSNYAIVIHGGAGSILRENLSAEMEAAYREKLMEALKVGEAILKGNGTSVDAVVETIKIMEDSPLFNAGKGSVYTHDGKNEMDASIMNGKDMSAGAVAGVVTIKNPIEAAREVMEHSKHVMLSGSGAVEFAKERGITIVDSAYFYNERRLQQLKKAKDKENVILDHYGDHGMIDPAHSEIEFDVTLKTDDKFGTVGCVALDQYGNLAAGTSTGGMTNKRYGRIGDSPIVGAGTYADDKTCAISTTGHGEYFIRLAVAKEISAQMEHGSKSLQEAAENVIHTKLAEIGGTGGVIAIDANGNIAMPFNTSGMYRGYIDTNGKMEVLIFKNN
jgi:beta-aspartyl-peptidase (threonine type)